MQFLAKQVSHQRSRNDPSRAVGRRHRTKPLGPNGERARMLQKADDVVEIAPQAQRDNLRIESLGQIGNGFGPTVAFVDPQQIDDLQPLRPAGSSRSKLHAFHVTMSNEEGLPV